MDELLKLDLGCGKADVAEGFIGVDIFQYGNVKIIADLKNWWPWDDNSVDEAVSRYLVNYLKPADRIFFVNQLYRVLKPGGKANIITPHWCCNKAYGDLNAVMPPVSEDWFFHLNKKWREEHAYWATDYVCDFDFTLGYSLHPYIIPRNQEYQQNAIQFWKESAQDMAATLIKK